MQRETYKYHYNPAQFDFRNSFYVDLFKKNYIFFLQIYLLDYLS